MGEIEGDAKKKICFYDCTATRPKTENKTKEESTDPQTDTISITMSPRSTDKAIKAVIETKRTKSNCFMIHSSKKVYEKDATAEVWEVTYENN